MFLYALDNPAPSSIMLISGDVDFSPALHVLGQRGYTIILVIPSAVGVSSALCNAGSHVWDWSSIAHGQGFEPTSRSQISDVLSSEGHGKEKVVLLKKRSTKTISKKESKKKKIMKL